jgi:hypothetical protein
MLERFESKRAKRTSPEHRFVRQVDVLTAGYPRTVEGTYAENHVRTFDRRNAV